MKTAFGFTILGVIAILTYTAIFEADKIPSCCPTQSAQAGGEQAVTGGGVIRVASDDPRMPGIVAGMNAYTRAQGITFQAVSRNASSEIEVEFMSASAMEGQPRGRNGRVAGGVDYGYGPIILGENMDGRYLHLALLHEIIHRGGYRRHDNNRQSVMYYHPGGTYISPEHWAALRSLAGNGEWSIW